MPCSIATRILSVGFPAWIGKGTDKQRIPNRASQAIRIFTSWPIVVWGMCVGAPRKRRQFVCQRLQTASYMKKKILIAEENPAVNRVLRLLLNPLYETIPASYGSFETKTAAWCRPPLIGRHFSSFLGTFAGSMRSNAP